MIPTITGDWVFSNDFIAEELFEAIADIAAGNAKLNLNVFGIERIFAQIEQGMDCLLYTSPSPRDQRGSRMPSSA